ncbi:peptidoglycan-associated lipoprotein Pal [Marinomonas epiphytica]
MSAHKLGKLAVVGLSAAWIVGCSTTASETDSSTSAEEAAVEQAEEAAGNSDAAYGAGSDGSLTSVIVDEEAAAAQAEADAKQAAMDLLASADTVFYFDFDKSIVRPESRESLAIHAQYLVANPEARIVLEGHADERGTREYNMALGERRAKAISRYLTIQGVAASQIETVSFGEEVPVAFGHDSAAWQLNRRVEVRYE